MDAGVRSVNWETQLYAIIRSKMNTLKPYGVLASDVHRQIKLREAARVVVDVTVKKGRLSLDVVLKIVQVLCLSNTLMYL